jgi:Leucine-rich repeat (LRR) protein
VGVAGRIPASIERLAHLRVLDLSKNKIRGARGVECRNGSCTCSLTALVPAGEIPASIGKLSALRRLDLQRPDREGKTP